MFHSIEVERLAQWQRIRDQHSHSTEKETLGYLADAMNRRDVATRQIAKFEEEVAWAEGLTCESANLAPEHAEKLEADKAEWLKYPRYCLEEQRAIYESACASIASFEAAFRFEETSDLVKWHGSIFKEQPRKRTTVTRKRKISRR